MALAAMKVYYPCALDIATTIVLQTRGTGVSPGISITREQNGGAVDDDFLAIGGAVISLTGSTSAVASFLNSAGIDGKSISASPLQLYFTQGSLGGTRTSGSTHLKAAMAKGLLIPVTASAGHNQVATIDWKASPVYDGTNNPVIITNNVALPTMTGTHEEFTCGPVTANGSDVVGIQNISVNFGLREEIVGDAGRTWPRYVGIQGRQPAIVCRTTDASFLATLSIAGTVISGSTVAYFRKVSDGATRVADVTEEHISFTVEQGIIYPGDLRVNHPNYADQSFTIVASKGANAILIIDTTAAIV